MHRPSCPFRPHGRRLSAPIRIREGGDGAAAGSSVGALPHGELRPSIFLSDAHLGMTRTRARGGCICSIGRPRLDHTSSAPFDFGSSTAAIPPAVPGRARIVTAPASRSHLNGNNFCRPVYLRPSACAPSTARSRSSAGPALGCTTATGSLEGTSVTGCCGA
jgi:hypothetical protein